MKAETLFVDFFDTIMFRRIHPFSVIERWAYNICHKYELTTTPDRVVRERNNCFSKILESRNEVVYADAIALLYEVLASAESGLKKKCSTAEFISYSHDMEIALEVGVQYPNSVLIERLRKEKAKGTQIYIVSDFYFGKEELKYFCFSKGIEIALFDGVFVSADYNATKSSGKLYQIVLAVIRGDPSSVCMIGDNPVSDGAMAKKQGLQSTIHRRILHKAWLHCKHLRNYNYSKDAGKIITSYYYRNGLPFSEYISVFFSFTERLKAELENNDKVVFLAREGHFLKRLFELYDNLKTPIGKKNETAYFLCSRRAITTTQIQGVHKLAESSIDLYHYLISAGFTDEEIPHFLETNGYQRDMLNCIVDDTLIQRLDKDVKHRVEKNKQALSTYADLILGHEISEDKIHFVDIGWYGSMQMGIEKLLNIRTKGFYLGTTGNDDALKKKGLVFSESTAKKEQTFYDILRTNIQLYEQLSAAPHGSAQAYVLRDGKPEVPLCWVDNERELFDSVIKEWQDNAITVFSALAVWAPDNKLMFTNRQNAYLVLRSALFANKERRDFLRKLDAGFVWNFGQDSKGTKYSRKGVPISLKLLYAPEVYTRYAAKIQRLLPDNSAIQLAYRLFACMFSLYVKTVLLIKRAR